MKKDMILNNYENTKRRGAVGLGVAIAYFTKLGHIVSIPLNDSQDYDLIVDDGDKLKKIQVKTVNCKSNGHYKVELRTHTSRGRTKDFSTNSSDYIFILTEEGIIYLIPTNCLSVKTAITLTKKYAEYIVN